MKLSHNVFAALLASVLILGGCGGSSDQAVSRSVDGTYLMGYDYTPMQGSTQLVYANNNVIGPALSTDPVGAKFHLAGFLYPPNTDISELGTVTGYITNPTYTSGLDYPTGGTLTLDIDYSSPSDAPAAVPQDFVLSGHVFVGAYSAASIVIGGFITVPGEENSILYDGNVPNPFFTER